MTPDGDFFIGWANRWPRRHGRALWGFALAMLVLLPASGVLLARTQTDPGGGNGDWGDQRSVTGLFTARPYPVIHTAAGHAMLLSGAGKYNVEIDPRAFDGKTVTMTGAVFKRGSIDMLVVSDPGSVQAVAPAGIADVAVPLGKWRVVGEICDGKCESGVMRPGTGLAHKACASLCLIGGVPPVLVSAGPIDGTEFFLLAGPDGGPMPETLLRWVGVRVRMEGELERRGDILVFKADPASVKPE